MCPHLSMYYGWSVSGVCSEQPPEHGKHLPWTNRSTFSRSELLYLKCHGGLFHLSLFQFHSNTTAMSSTFTCCKVKVEFPTWLCIILTDLYLKEPFPFSGSFGSRKFAYILNNHNHLFRPGSWISWNFIIFCFVSSFLFWIWNMSVLRVTKVPRWDSVAAKV